MGGVAAAVEAINRAIADQVRSVAPYRAIVTAVDGDLVAIRRHGAATAASRKVASCAHALLAIGDEVLVVNLNGEPIIVDRIKRGAAATPTSVLDANAGSTATRSIVGGDDDFELTIASAGTGQATGSLIDITFASPRPSALYNVLISPKNSAARGLGGVVGQSTSATTHVLIATNTPLVAGSSYTWGVQLRQYG